LEAVERTERLAEARTPGKTAELAETVRNAKAGIKARVEAFETLAAAHADPQTLFPLACDLASGDEPALRAVAVETLAAMLKRGEAIDKERAASILARAAGSEDAGIRRACANGLASLKTCEAVQALAELLGDEDRLVRMTSCNVLVNLSGDSFGYEYIKPPVDQTAALEKWQAWAKAWKPEAQ